MFLLFLFPINKFLKQKHGNNTIRALEFETVLETSVYIFFLEWKLFIWSPYVICNFTLVGPNLLISSAAVEVLIVDNSIDADAKRNCLLSLIRHPRWRSRECLVIRFARIMLFDIWQSSEIPPYHLSYSPCLCKSIKKCGVADPVGEYVFWRSGVIWFLDPHYHRIHHIAKHSLGLVQINHIQSLLHGMDTLSVELDYGQLISAQRKP